jgi:hypothetical protein
MLYDVANMFYIDLEDFPQSTNLFDIYLVDCKTLC